MTFRKLATAAAGVALIAGLAACTATAAGTVTPGGTASSAPAGAAQMTATVTIKDMKFDPATVTIKKGGTVTWKNMDTMKHDAAESATKTWFTLLGNGESGSKKFDATGDVNYVCSVHANMKGVVKVVE